MSGGRPLSPVALTVKAPGLSYSNQGGSGGLSSWQPASAAMSQPSSPQPQAVSRRARLNHSSSSGGGGGGGGGGSGSVHAPLPAGGVSSSVAPSMMVQLAATVGMSPVNVNHYQRAQQQQQPDGAARSHARQPTPTRGLVGGHSSSWVRTKRHGPPPGSALALPMRPPPSGSSQGRLGSTR